MNADLFPGVVDIETTEGPNGVRAGAVVSDCGRYRYCLTRRWVPGRDVTAETRPLVLVMLNPSTANATEDDPTIRKCMGFARRLGRGGIIVANLFAWRATKPADLWRAAAEGQDVVGPVNVHALVGAMRAAPDVVFAWGAQPARHVAERVRQVVDIAHDLARYVRCWGVSADGSPRHPLMLPYTTPLVGWPVGSDDEDA